MNEDDPEFMRQVEAKLEQGDDETIPPLLGLHIVSTYEAWLAALSTERSSLRTARMSYWYAWIFGTLSIAYVMVGSRWVVVGFAAVLALQGLSLRSSTKYRERRLEALLDVIDRAKREPE